ncbi:MAG: hypothetical protein ACXAC7_04205 [Candidatus Hodarchaeales archaeon]|jgi:translation elongation factor aEF-1 beta
MANVLTILKLTPSDPELNREEFVINVIEKQLCKECNVEYLKYDEEPLAFGIYLIKPYFKTPDSEEGTDNINKLEELLSEREELQNVEMDLQTLMDH